MRSAGEDGKHIVDVDAMDWSVPESREQELKAKRGARSTLKKKPTVSNMRGVANSRIVKAPAARKIAGYYDTQFPDVERHHDKGATRPWAGDDTVDDDDALDEHSSRGNSAQLYPHQEQAYEPRPAPAFNQMATHSIRAPSLRPTPYQSDRSARDFHQTPYTGPRDESFAPSDASDWKNSPQGRMFARARSIVREEEFKTMRDNAWKYDPAVQELKDKGRVKEANDLCDATIHLLRMQRSKAESSFQE